MDLNDLFSLFFDDEEDKKPKKKQLTPRTDTMVDNTFVYSQPPIPQEFSSDHIKDEDLYNWFPKMQWMDWHAPSFKNSVLDAQIWTESRGNPNAVSPAGAAGLTQFMPITWTEAKRQKWIPQDASRMDPEMALQAQYRLMDDLYNKPEMVSEEPTERLSRTLAAYNAGYGNLRKALRKAKKTGGYWLDYMTAETKKYIPQILNSADKKFNSEQGRYISMYDRNAFY